MAKRPVHRLETQNYQAEKWDWKCLDWGQRWFVVDGWTVLSGHRTRARARHKAKEPKFPCAFCGGDIGWDAPSGVCSTECLTAAQR